MDSVPTLKFDPEDAQTRELLLPHCRLNQGDIWRDPEGRHTVGCGDASEANFVCQLAGDSKAVLAVHDPPYNMVTGPVHSLENYIDQCRQWVELSHELLAEDAALYVWLGADQKNHFQPLPQFMAMMSETEFESRSYITMRNQRGYGTQKNWMAIRQELLYYTKGNPQFEVKYTDIPKVLRGYYKKVGDTLTENGERSKSPNIRSGNVWVDIQQVFYRMEENIEGCYAQKPLQAIERIIEASSKPGDTVIDFFAHSGTTALACERTGRRCITCDIDPIYAEIAIRRLERFRSCGKTGWQRSHPFETELQASAATISE